MNNKVNGYKSVNQVLRFSLKPITRAGPGRSPIWYASKAAHQSLKSLHKVSDKVHLCR